MGRRVHASSAEFLLMSSTVASDSAHGYLNNGARRDRSCKHEPAVAIGIPAREMNDVVLHVNDATAPVTHRLLVTEDETGVTTFYLRAQTCDHLGTKASARDVAGRRRHTGSTGGYILTHAAITYSRIPGGPG